MKSIDQPKKIAIQFAKDGIKNVIPEASQIGINDGAASFTDGFPPLNFTPLVAGGIPPAGGDFNGALYSITDIQRWQSAGGLFKFDIAFSNLVGGYQKGAMLINSNATGVWISKIDNNVVDPDSDSTNWGIADAATLAALLAAPNGATRIGLPNGETVASKVAKYDARKLSLTGFNTVIDGDSINATGGGGTNWADVIGTMSNFAGRGTIANVAVPGRSMAGTWAAFAANVLPKIVASIAAGIPILVILDLGSNDYGLRPASEVFTPYDQYRSAVINAGGTFMPMLPMRRFDWASFEGVRLSIRDHILQAGDPLTVATDLIFTDPDPTPRPGFVTQTDDGTHPNVVVRFNIAVAINGIVGAGYGSANINTALILRPLAGSQIPYTNALGQLTTDGTFNLLLSTNGAKDLLRTTTNSFSTAGKTGDRYVIPGNNKSWEIATVGDTSDFSPQLTQSFVVFDLFANTPLLAMSTYKQVSTLYGNWGIRRGGPTSDLETLGSIVAYPAANNSPGKVGQFAYNGAKTKIAIYAGDGISSHSWVAAAATTSV